MDLFLTKDFSDTFNNVEKMIQGISLASVLILSWDGKLRKYNACDSSTWELYSDITEAFSKDVHNFHNITRNHVSVGTYNNI